MQQQYATTCPKINPLHTIWASIDCGVLHISFVSPVLQVMQCVGFWVVTFWEVHWYVDLAVVTSYNMHTSCSRCAGTAAAGARHHLEAAMHVLSYQRQQWPVSSVECNVELTACCDDWHVSGYS